MLHTAGYSNFLFYHATQAQNQSDEKVYRSAAPQLKPAPQWGVCGSDNAAQDCTYVSCLRLFRGSA